MQLTEKQKASIINGTKVLAGYCDGAKELDGMGFNKFDTERGKRWASKSLWTSIELLLMFQLIWKYKKQLSDELQDTLREIETIHHLLRFGKTKSDKT
jgi:hypothetical protein